MKTFKLKMLRVLNDDKDQDIHLIDGLIINREDDSYINQWLIEAFIGKEYAAYFEKRKEKEEVVRLMVKISKEENDPVEFISTIIGVNYIGENINVLFKGDIKRER